MPVTDTNYNSTLAVTDVVNQDGVFDMATAVGDDGTWQGALFTLLNNIVTKFAGVTAKLDADGGVTDTDYAANCDLTALAIAGIDKNGIHQNELVAALQEIETNFEILTAQLDADAGVTDTNYGTTLNFDMDTTAIQASGISQGEIVSYLQTVITQFNALLTKLDADA